VGKFLDITRASFRRSRRAWDWWGWAKIFHLQRGFRVGVRAQLVFTKIDLKT
jgi:hypothetical protein